MHTVPYWVEHHTDPETPFEVYAVDRTLELFTFKATWELTLT